MEPAERFEGIADALVARLADAEHDEFLGHPAVAIDGEVAFYFAQDGAVFLLGDGVRLDLPHTHSEPVKTEPPMMAWYRVEATEAESWSDLAWKAIKFVRR